MHVWICTALLGAVSLARAADTPWFRNCLVGMEVGPTGAQFGYSDPDDTRYCSQFDGREIVRRAVDAHSEYLVLWARDGDYAYRDSCPKRPGLGIAIHCVTRWMRHAGMEFPSSRTVLFSRAGTF